MKQFLLLILLSVFALSSCQKNIKSDLEKLKKDRATLDKKIALLQKEFDKQNPTKQKAVAVYVETVQLVPFKKYIQLQGKIDAQNNVLANALSSSVITKILVKNGQYVKKNQILAYLDNNVLVQGIREADQQILFAKDLYDRQKNLWSQDIGTKVQLLTAQNGYEAAVKRKKSLLAQKDLYVIKSPISGVVDDVMVKVGEIVSPGMPKGIRVINDTELKIVTDIGEGYISSVNSGDEVSVLFPDIRDSLHTKVSFVSKTINEINRSFKAEIHLPFNKNLKPNMLAEIKIASYTNPKAILVNFGLIQNDAQGDYMMVIRQGKLTKTRIKKGESYNGQTEIIGGIELDDEIITAGFDGLQEGDEIKIVKQE
jgi:membrane fusion protein, multidrug efflux system